MYARNVKTLKYFIRIHVTCVLFDNLLLNLCIIIDILHTCTFLPHAYYM